MIQFESKPGTVVGFVPISKSAEDFSIADIGGGKKTIGWFTEKRSIEVPIPLGDWQILAPTDEISEEQIDKILNRWEGLYEDYYFHDGIETEFFDDPHESFDPKPAFASLLTHLNIKGPHLVIYKNEG